MSEPTWIVIPTYNERENIERLLRAVDAQLAGAVPGGYRVLVVDDGSPDGTGALAERVAVELGTVEVLHRRSKDGLGRAYVAGFRRALDAGAQMVVEMDADFSHDPAHLPRLLAAARTADVVLGSRYVRGGGVENWSLTRRLLSRGGSLYARHMLGVPVRDLTGGFKCIRRRVLESIGLDSIGADGYAFQIELTALAFRAGFTVVEVPIVFADRTAGTSKMSGRIALEAVWLVAALRRRLPDPAAPAPGAAPPDAGPSPGRPRAAGEQPAAGTLPDRG